MRCLPVKFARQRTRLCSFDSFKIIHGFAEAYLFYEHDHVDGVKVFFTQETSCQIGFRVGRRGEFSAKRAKETKIAFRDLCGQFEKFCDHKGDWDFVSQLS
jgi:hypothetical protein